jgi:hypothetical protein
MAWGKTTKIRKYREGVRILGIYEMIPVLLANRYIIVRGKPYHPAVLRNWSLGSLTRICHYDQAHVAELTPEWIAAEEMRAEIAREEAAVVDGEFTKILAVKGK